MAPRFIYIAICLILVGCQTVQLQNPQRVSSEDWLTDGQHPSKQRSYALSVDPPLEKIWEYNAAAGFGPGSPLIVNGTVLVSTRKGEVHSIDLETGRRRGFKAFGEGIEGSPVVSDGKLFVPIDMGRRSLTAWDLAKGNTAWRKKDTFISAGLSADQEAIYAVDIKGVIYAILKEDGETKWTYDLGHRAIGKASPLLLSTG